MAARPLGRSAPAACDLAAFEEMVARARPRLKALLYRRRIPPADAEDLVQEVFLLLLNRWEEVERDVVHPERWLLRVAELKSCSYFGRPRWLVAVEEDELTERAGLVAPPQLRVEDAHDLGKLLAGLAPRQRARLWMHLGLGLSPEEIAARTGCRPKSVRKLVQRALQKVQGAAKR